jgi:hypothetical protein
VTFTGGGLESLDEVTCTILDEALKDRWSGRLPPRVPQEEAEAFVWGPWESNTSASVQTATNRTPQTRPTRGSPAGTGGDRADGIPVTQHAIAYLIFALIGTLGLGSCA